MKKYLLQTMNRLAKKIFRYSLSDINLIVYSAIESFHRF